MIIMGATLGLTLSSSSASISVIGSMIFWRVILGIGVGGDYPISSIITSEFATLRWRGAMMSAVFASQGFGQFTAALVSFITTVGFKESLQVTTCGSNCQEVLDKSWRIIYGFLRRFDTHWMSSVTHRTRQPTRPDIQVANMAPRNGAIYGILRMKDLRKQVGVISFITFGNGRTARFFSGQLVHGSSWM